METVSGPSSVVSLLSGTVTVAALEFTVVVPSMFVYGKLGQYVSCLACCRRVNQNNVLI